MTLDKIEAACAEARRFIEKASEAAARIKRETEAPDGAWISYQHKERAAARRASLDLTRALAEMRRSD
jgi:hypothetical protein